MSSSTPSSMNTSSITEGLKTDSDSEFFFFAKATRGPGGIFRNEGGHNGKDEVLNPIAVDTLSEA